MPVFKTPNKTKIHLNTVGDYLCITSTSDHATRLMWVSLQRELLHRKPISTEEGVVLFSLEDCEFSYEEIVAALRRTFKHYEFVDGNRKQSWWQKLWR